MGNLSALSARFVTERERIGLTQAELAVKTTVDRKTVGNFERGVSAPNALFLADCSKLGIDVGYVLAGKRTPPGNSAPALDLRLLEEVVEAGVAALDEAQLKLPPKKFAQLCSALYELQMESGARPAKGAVLRLVRSAA